MNGKLIILAVGVGIGFLLGSRAGRGPYERVAKCTKEFWEDPRVQQQVERSVAFANDRFEDLAEVVTTGTRNVVHRMTAPKPAQSSASRSKRSTGKSASSSRTSKPDAKAAAGG